MKNHFSKILPKASLFIIGIFNSCTLLFNGGNYNLLAPNSEMVISFLYVFYKSCVEFSHWFGTRKKKNLMAICYTTIIFSNVMLKFFPMSYFETLKVPFQNIIYFLSLLCKSSNFSSDI